MRRNLLIVRAGNNSCHPGWVRGAMMRDFDLLVSYYGTESGKYHEGSDLYHQMSGPRWPAHAAICREQSDLIKHYDFVGFACDDLKADFSTWDKLFAVCRRYSLDLAQPAIIGHRTYDITRPRFQRILRFTNFVEIMCPVFSQRALNLLSSTFEKSISGWGLDFVWGSLLTQDDRIGEYRIGIIDCARVRHSRPARKGSLYSALSDKGVDPFAEKRSLEREYGIEAFSPTVYAYITRASYFQNLTSWAYRGVTLPSNVAGRISQKLRV